MSNVRLRAVVAIVASLALTAVLLNFISFVKSLPPSLVTEVTSKNFDDQVVNSPLPVFVEFYLRADEDSQAQAPIVEKLAKEYEGKVRFVKIDVAKSKALATRLAVRKGDVPAYLILKLQGGTGLFKARRVE